jgi:hypothetical protein
MVTLLVLAVFFIMHVAVAQGKLILISINLSDLYVIFCRRLSSECCDYECQNFNNLSLYATHVVMLCHKIVLTME